MGETSAGGGSASGGGGRGDGDIDWNSVFAELSRPRPFVPGLPGHPLAQPQTQASRSQQQQPPAQQDGDSGFQYDHQQFLSRLNPSGRANNLGLWDHILSAPPYQNQPQSAAESPITPVDHLPGPRQASGQQTPALRNDGPSRLPYSHHPSPEFTSNGDKQRNRHSFPSSISAPVTPSLQYGGHEHLFANLATSLYALQPESEQRQPVSSAAQGLAALAQAGKAKRSPQAGPSKSNSVSNGSSRAKLKQKAFDRVPPPWSAEAPLVSSPLSHSGDTSSSYFPAFQHSQHDHQPTPHGGGGAASQPSSSGSTPLIPIQPGTPLVSAQGVALDTEDKRQRNTLASAKFRAKRKKHVAGVQHRINELEQEHTDLVRSVGELKQENKFLREMVEMKYGLNPAPGGRRDQESDDEGDPQDDQGDAARPRGS